MNVNDATAPQLTVRAVILAVVLAVILAAANTYLGLFAGMLTFEGPSRPRAASRRR